MVALNPCAHANQAAFERLSDAWTNYLLLDGQSEAHPDDVATAEAAIRAQNRLIDACIDCGMPHDGDEFEFAAAMVAAWLVSGSEAA